MYFCDVNQEDPALAAHGRGGEPAPAAWGEVEYLRAAHRPRPQGCKARKIHICISVYIYISINIYEYIYIHTYGYTYDTLCLNSSEQF